MSSIAFLLDTNEQIRSSLPLALALRKEGHFITYLNKTNDENDIAGIGCRLFGIDNERQLIYGIIDGELDEYFQTSKPDMLIISSSMMLESLVLYYKYNFYPVILTTLLTDPAVSLIDQIIDRTGDLLAASIDFILRLGIKHNSLTELIKPVDKFSEIVLCPIELEMDQAPSRTRTYHTGPYISPVKKAECHSDLYNNRVRKNIIYFSTDCHTECQEKDGQQIIAELVRLMNHTDLDVTIEAGRSRIELIKQASLVISHGQLDVIKECIYYEVPLIVFPRKREELRHAMLVEYHQLGISKQVELIVEENFREDIQYVMNDVRIQNSITSMGTIFRQKEEMNEAIGILNALLKEGLQHTNSASGSA
jgi:UDP-N-acetylglucosamine transferase subunit ALG13